MLRVISISLVLVLLVADAAKSEQLSPDDLSVRSVFALVEQSPSQFTRQWNERYDRARRVEGANISAIRAARARGFIDYAYFHWRETGEQVPSNWRSLRRAVSAVDINDAGLLELPEQRQFLESWLRHQARRALADNPALQRGDNVWLRARFHVVEAQVRDNEVQRFLLRSAIATHIDENTAVGVPELIDRYAMLTGAPDSETAPLRQAAAEDLALRDGHRIEVYKTANDVGLELHLLSPNQPQLGARPALIWFHGGSWATGSWAHCPMICRLAREQGYIAVQVDYRTSDRFNTTPLEAVADGRDALAFVRAHALELGIDPERIVVSGFSAGGSIAAILATSSPPHAVRGALLVSACTTPMHDSWFRRSVGDSIRDLDLIPIANLDSEDSAILALQGTSDEMCPYEDVEAFVHAAQSARLDAELVTLDGASHFFVFNNPPARARASERAEAFLARWR